MKQILSTLLLLLSLTITAQTTVVTGPKKKQQTTAVDKKKPQTEQAPKATFEQSSRRTKTSRNTSQRPPATKPQVRPSSASTKTKSTLLDNDYYLTQAQNGDVNCQFYVAECYYDGKNGFKKDDILAKHWYNKAAEQGHVEAMSCLADMYFDENNYDKAYSWYSKAANEGDIDAIVSLGEMYLFGYGVEINYDTAVEYLKNAVDKGDILGKYFYGYCLYYGVGVKKDTDQAQFYYNQCKTVAEQIGSNTPVHYSKMNPPVNLTPDPFLFSETHSPRVAKQFKETVWGKSTLTRVFLTDQFTLVEFDYFCKNAGWVSLSSGTIMKSKYSQKTYRSLDWGYKDKDGKFQSLKFDEKANTEKNANYSLYMVFEPVDHKTDNISIYENGKEGFYWEGIQLSPFRESTEQARQELLGGGHENFNTSVSGNSIDTGSHTWSVISVQGTSSGTIVNKRCNPKSSSSYVWSDNNEFIEDCDTGKRYYLIDSEIGVGASNSRVLSNSNAFTYKESYPKLPVSVTRINISSGSKYYAKNVMIR